MNHQFYIVNNQVLPLFSHIQPNAFSKKLQSLVHALPRDDAKSAQLSPSHEKVLDKLIDATNRHAIKASKEPKVSSELTTDEEQGLKARTAENKSDIQAMLKKHDDWKPSLQEMESKVWKKPMSNNPSYHPKMKTKDTNDKMREYSELIKTKISRSASKRKLVKRFSEKKIAKPKAYQSKKKWQPKYINSDTTFDLEPGTQLILDYPAGLQSYPNSDDKTWTIEAPEGNVSIGLMMNHKWFSYAYT